MQAGYQIQDGGRVDVATVKESRRVRVDIARAGGNGLSATTTITLTLSEARAISSALMGAAAEA